MTRQAIKYYVRRISQLQSRIHKTTKARPKKTFQQMIARYATIIRNYNWTSNNWTGLKTDPIGLFYIRRHWATIMDAAEDDMDTAEKMYYKLFGFKITDKDLYIGPIVHKARLYSICGTNPSEHPHLITLNEFDTFANCCIKELKNAKITK